MKDIWKYVAICSKQVKSIFAMSDQEARELALEHYAGVDLPIDLRNAEKGTQWLYEDGQWKKCGCETNHFGIDAETSFIKKEKQRQKL